MRMSSADLLAHHEASVSVYGEAVVVLFPDQGAAAAFRDELLLEANEIPRGAARLVRALNLLEGPDPHQTILELIDGDMRKHRFFVGIEDLKVFATIPLVAQAGAEPVAPDSPQSPGAKEQDDLRELAVLHERLGRAEEAIRLQRRRMNALQAAFAERFVHPNGRFPSYCCQRCGEVIGWIGRAFQAVGVPVHTCAVARTDDLDAQGER